MGFIISKHIPRLASSTCTTEKDDLPQQFSMGKEWPKQVEIAL